jgi:NAD(P)-dependent dehydrogenase (short-subunit alcohol dehydrogenase family)
MMLGKPARIVNVSSLGQHPIDFDDVMLTRGYSGSRAYAQSKLAQIMFTFDLARELDPAVVTLNCLHPATYMATTMVRQSASSRSARSRKARKQSSIWQSRKSSMDIPASSTTGCGHQRRTHRLMTRPHGSGCVCSACA